MSAVWPVSFDISPRCRARAARMPAPCARMWLKQVTDEELLTTLNEGGREGTLYFEIVSIRSLG